MDYISNRLSQLRIAKGVSAREMSIAIGQNQNYINGIENGKTLPSMLAFFYICEYLKITPCDFFSYQNSSPAESSELISIIQTLDSKDLALVDTLVKRIKS